MANYPSRLAHEHTLFDGRKVLIRPIRADDGLLERDFLRQRRVGRKPLSALSQMGRRSLRQADPLPDRHRLRPPHGLRLRFRRGRRLGGRGRGALRRQFRRRESCEFGVVIADVWRKSGVAGLLMEALIRAARERGLTSMEGLVLRNNPPMLRFARALGFEVHSVAEDPLTLRIVKKL